MKITTIILLLTFNIVCAQTTMKSVNDAKKIELNKKEFIGKPLSYLLSKMSVEIKSVLPVPNKNKSEINRVIIRYISDYEYRKTSSKEIEDRPTQLTVVFNQNWGLSGEICKSIYPNCINWTKEDEKNLGDLIVYDIYVLGKN
ncbi:MAG: hypothetical protein Q4G16_10480 [Cruoricaptor ignavus]|nr:hypothetical protein [Cruoricaptor ignavus]